MEDIRKRLIMYYTKILNNFRTLEELEGVLIKLFGHDMWNKIRKLIKSRGTLRKSDLPRIVSFCLQEVTTEYLEAKLLYLQLSDVVLHSNKRNWSTFQLCGKRNSMILSARGLTKEFLAVLKKNNIQFDVKIIMHQEIVWIGLSKLNAKTNSPIFLAYFVGEDCLFSTRRAINGKLMQAVTAALKCEALKRVNLDGHDVWSLFKMTKQKDSNAVEPARKKRKLENLNPILPMGAGVDYTRGKIRKAAMEKCLGKNPPILNSLTIKSESGLRVKKFLPEMEGYPAKATLRIKHENLPEILKLMAERNILVEPLPQYLKSISLTGKNTLYLKDGSARKLPV